MAFRELFNELTAEAAWFARADHDPVCVDVILRNMNSRLWSSMIDDVHRRVRYKTVTFSKRCTKYRVVFEYAIPHDSQAVTEEHTRDEVPLLMHTVGDEHTVWSSYPVLVKITKRQGIRIRMDWRAAFIYQGFEDLGKSIQDLAVADDNEHSWSDNLSTF
jgi:hypothetical protein